jgi:superfamily II DNA or RNA helicase
MLKDSHAMAGQDAPAQEPSKQRATGKTARARAVLDRPPQAQGWNTTDEEEIALRRWRGRTEVIALEALEPKQPIFGTFRSRAVPEARFATTSGGSYEIEIRSFDQHINSCGCIDHRVNGLGTCKHIEGVLAVLRRQDAAAFDVVSKTRQHYAIGAGSARIEIFLDRRGAARPALVWPVSGGSMRAARDWLRPFLRSSGLKSSGELDVDPGKVAKLLAAWQSAPTHVRRSIRVSRHINPWVEREQRQRSRVKARAKFLGDVERGKASFDLVKLPLLPYQREGMLHLAFGERALLADEMGLGKTVQAIAACELLARRKGIAKVLVVCPASLKAEWEEQIAHFTDRPAQSVFGPRGQRLATYGKPVFFNIVNYEQVLVDADDINQILAPDVVILDEAQRIKNWQTKTARRVKQLRAPYAFVLTGTPLENRIDELYSIVQYLDPELFGPLFRFNRDFYDLDERGRPVDYKNLGELRDRVAPIMLRRRKADVESELPGRTVTNYFVPMAEEQRTRYEEYKVQAARIVAIAQRRPLLPKEFERLMMLLACMRMICDTPAILDPTCRVSPKLEELERILGDLLEEPDRKVIVFSEWETMLGMVRELAGEMGIEVAWHTGSVPQQRRRAEIVRFKQDPKCRLFLSTDSGSVGLNLQVASAVVNVDLPWNPAKLEQRIARAWRKGQMRGVTVVNLVCEDSIEHGMVHLLGAKQALADGVIDGQGDLAALKMPSGRGAMIERMQALMQAAETAGTERIGPRGATPPTALPEEAIAAQLQQSHGARALLVEARQGSDGRTRVLAVLDLASDALKAETQRLAAADGSGPAVEIIDRATWITLRRLQASGMIQIMDGSPRVLHRATGLTDSEAEYAANALQVRLTALRGEADRALRMAHVLAAGGFPEEVLPLLAKAIGHGAAIKLAVLDELPADVTLAAPARIRDLVERKALPLQAIVTLDALAAASGTPAGAEIERLLKTTAEVLLACIEGAEAMDARDRV